MTNFAVSVEQYMSAPVLTVGRSTSLTQADALMRENDISSLAVTDSDDDVVGIVSRTDLLRLGSRQTGSRGKSALLVFPESKTVADVMSTNVATVSPKATCAEAARQMMEKRFHRLLVRDNEPVGLISPHNLMQLIVDTKLNRPLSDFMSSPLFTVQVDDPVSAATERLEQNKITGLVVVEGEWPVGLFTQREALECASIARDTPVENVMTPAFLSLAADTPIHRAAAMAASLGVRRVIALENGRAVGILTGLDFAKAVAT